MIRLILADDHKIMRDGLSALMSKSPEFEIVAVAESGRKAFSLARKEKPDIILMDLSMPDLNGIEACRQIVYELPKIKIIILSAHSDMQHIEESFKAGASGYLLKDCTYDELVKALQAVHNGHYYLTPSIASMVIKDYKELLRQAPETTYSLLSSREKEVLQLIAEEHSTIEMARIMNLSPKTVETYRASLMQRLNVHNIAGLTKIAIKMGLISL